MGYVTYQRTPTLVPDFDPAFLHGQRVELDDNLVERYVDGGFGTLAHGSQTLTIGNDGSNWVTTDVITVEFSVGSSPVKFSVSVAAGSTTLATIATTVKNAINAAPGVAQLVYATVATTVVTVTAVRPGILSNFKCRAYALTTAGTPTLHGTLQWASDTAGTDVKKTLAGGTGNMITPLETFSLQIGTSTVSLYAFRPVRADINMSNALANSGRLVI